MKAVEEGKQHAIDSKQHFDDILNASEETLKTAELILEMSDKLSRL